MIAHSRGKLRGRLKVVRYLKNAFYRNCCLLLFDLYDTPFGALAEPILAKALSISAADGALVNALAIGITINGASIPTLAENGVLAALQK